MIARPATLAWLTLRWFCLAVVVGLSPSNAVWAESLHEIIDREIEKQAGGPVSPPADDAEFLRRINLDLTGMPPTAEETKKFLADADPAKRENLIDKLLAGEHFPRRFQEAFSAMLLERRADTKVSDADWAKYLREAFATNQPWDKFVSELLFPEAADAKAKPAAKFLIVSGREDMQQKTRDVARLLLGRDIMCSQCHDHPTVADFTQADYFGLLAYLQDSPDKARPEFESVFVPGKHQTGPRLPGGSEVAIPAIDKSQKEDAEKYLPRKLLAADLPTASNELFVRNCVNRFWFLLMGRGLVHPLDLHHSNNPPSHPELLTLMAADFASSGFDVRRLLREIALSNAYQRSSRLPAGVAEHEAPPQSYRAAVAKPLSPEQMAWSVMQVTGNLPRMLAAPAPAKSDFTYNNYINGRITKAPDNFSDAMALFVGVFGNPPGEAEVEFNPAMGHSLFLMNEPLLLDWLKPQPGNLVERLSGLTEPRALTDELYLSVLTRFPTDEERAEAADYLAQNKSRRVEAIGELAWSLLASGEFRENH